MPKIFDLGINPAAWTRYALDFRNHWQTIMIFKFDMKLIDTGALFHTGKITDVTFTLKHIKHITSEPRRWAAHNILPGALAVPNACQHIAERITHCHFLISLLPA
jgi:hypothetical protein